jgi:hypothetical protein
MSASPPKAVQLGMSALGQKRTLLSELGDVGRWRVRIFLDRLQILLEVQKAKLGREEELTTLKRLDAEALKLERIAGGPSLQTFVASEKLRSHAFDGRSVFGFEARPKKLQRP